MLHKAWFATVNQFNNKPPQNSVIFLDVPLSVECMSYLADSGLDSEVPIEVFVGFIESCDWVQARHLLTDQCDAIRFSTTI